MEEVAGQQETEKQEISEGRINGRFAPGFSGNPLGRPKKKTFRDYFSEEDEAKLVELVKTQMYEKPEIAKLVVEQIFGKARQTVGMDGGLNDEGDVKPVLVKFIDNADH